MDKKISYLGQEDCRLWTVEDMLADTLQKVRDGKIKTNKGIFIGLDDTKRYNCGASVAKLSYPEIVALLEMYKSIAIEEFFS